MVGAEDTIVAVASAAGRGSRAVIRLSGRRALAALDALSAGAVSAMPSWSARAIDLASGDLRIRGWASVHRAPRSYTREDVVEIHVPASAALIDALTRALVAQEGVRFAGPGEFSLRAFLNGRLDLSRAEAVGQLIAAAGEDEARAARRVLEGELGARAELLRSRIVDAIASIEAALDFPDEDIAAPAKDEILRALDEIEGETAALRRASRLGVAGPQAHSVVIAGPANAGKTSLLNRIAGREAGIVSEHEGTTRDPVRATVDHGGTVVEWVDVAGFDPAAEAGAVHGLEELLDPATREVLRRLTLVEIAQADLVLWIVDARTPGVPAPPAALDAREPPLLVGNKIDVCSDDDLARLRSGAAGPVILVSALRGTGVDELVRGVIERCRRGRAAPAARSLGSDGAFLVSAHQQVALDECRESIGRARDALARGIGLEYAALELRGALTAIERLSGRTSIDEILGRIFSRFCIGK